VKPLKETDIEPLAKELGRTVGSRLAGHRATYEPAICLISAQSLRSRKLFEFGPTYMALTLLDFDAASSLLLQDGREGKFVNATADWLRSNEGLLPFLSGRSFMRAEMYAQCIDQGDARSQHYFLRQLRKLCLRKVQKARSRGRTSCG